MQNTQDYESFRISSGGLLYRFLSVLHIQDPGHYSTQRRIIFLIILSWLPLFFLTTLDGNLVNSSLDQPFIYDLKHYIKFLFVLPMLIAADVFIDPIIASNIQSIGFSGILAENDREQYNKAFYLLRQKKDSFLADLVILVLVVLTVISFLLNLEYLDVSTEFTNWMVIQAGAEARLTYAGWWFLVISSPVLQIILFRWFWRFYIWAEFLLHVSRIKLQLQPTHPDLTGGLGIIKTGEGAFILLFFAFGSMLSINLAEEIFYTDFTLAQAWPIVIIYIITSIIITTLPLLFFTKQLILAKRWGRIVYGGLGYKLSRAFDEKWGDPHDPSTGNRLLKTADTSAVCDYADIYDVVRNMRYLPIDLKGYMAQAIFLFIPFLPLAFTEIAAKEVLSRLFDTLI